MGAKTAQNPGLLAAVVLPKPGTQRLVWHPADGGSLLFGISSLDGVSFAAAALLLGLVSALAAFVPARSAARIDPIETLRAE